MFDIASFDLATLIPFILVGFAAQLVDGAMGMAFGVICNTLLVMFVGLPPAQASAKVHIVETFTTAVSGISHLVHGNIDRRLFFKLLIPGMIGGVGGAYLLTSIDGDTVKPFVLAYLVLMGFYLLYRGLIYPPKANQKPVLVEPLGLIGGFMDASGGGGWGPIVTSNLIVQGVEPRKVIGTVSAVEFFLTATISITFILGLGVETFAMATVGLLIGGVAAAPLGAYLAKHIPIRPLFIMVGVVLTLTSLFGLYRIFG